MTSHQTTQTMKPATAAKKLGVYLEATPAEFQEGVVSRSELNALQADPPEWLQELRRNGPHPRPVVAAKLGVSIAGLARGGVTDPLTTEQIDALKKDLPEWLRKERATQAEVRKEAARIKEKNAERAGQPQRPRSDLLLSTFGLDDAVGGPHPTGMRTADSVVSVRAASLAAGPTLHGWLCDDAGRCASSGVRTDGFTLTRRPGDDCEKRVASSDVPHRVCAPDR